MSYVDPADAADMREPPPNWSAVLLPEGGVELRVEVPLDDDTAEMRFVNTSPTPHDAEVFGSPLVDSGGYRLPRGASFAIWSWRGALLHFGGSNTFRSYGLTRSRSTGAAQRQRCLWEYHALLHELRTAAQHHQQLGPRVVICGGPASGKHTAAETIANLAVRQPPGWAPTVVDLDPRRSLLGPPGSVGVGAWEYGSVIGEGTSHLAAINFFVGHTAVLGADESGALSLSPSYVQAARGALDAAKRRQISQMTGFPGWSGSVAVVPSVADDAVVEQLVLMAAHLIDATHILCVGDEPLFTNLVRAIDPSSADPGVEPLPFALPVIKVTNAGPGASITLDRLSASPGAVDWSAPALALERRNLRLHQHFSGTSACRFAEECRPIPLSKLEVFIFIDGRDRTRPHVNRIPEDRVADEVETRNGAVGAVYRPCDSPGESPVWCFCHVIGVNHAQPKSVDLKLSVLLPEDLDRVSIVLGATTWLV